MRAAVPCYGAPYCRVAAYLGSPFGTDAHRFGILGLLLWSPGVPHDTLGNEILDGLPTPEDPLLGGDIRGHWENGKCVSYDKTRSLEKRLAEGDYEQSMSMQDVGLFGQSAMLPGHPSNPPLNPVIYGTIICAAYSGFGTSLSPCPSSAIALALVPQRVTLGLLDLFC